MAALIVVLMLTGLFTISADDGIGIDPNGGRRTASDNGSCIDPNGRPCPVQTILGDEGNGLDPHG